MSGGPVRSVASQPAHAAEAGREQGGQPQGQGGPAGLTGAAVKCGSGGIAPAAIEDDEEQAQGGQQQAQSEQHTCLLLFQFV